MRMNSALQSINQGVLICDKHAHILYFNQQYALLIGHSPDEAIGQHIHKFRPHALAPRVAKTGQAIEGVIREEQGVEYYASIYPIFESGELIGTISIVTSLDSENKKRQNRAASLAERVRKFERQEIELAVRANGGGTEGKRRAARELEISLATLYNKMKEQ